MLKVLQTYFEEVVVLHAGGPLDVARIEKWYGVRLDPERVRFETVSSPRWLRWVSRLFAVGRMPILLQYALVLRAARSMKAGADLIISTQGECAIWDASVIQYIHYPMFFLDRESLAHLGATDLRIDQWLARAGYVLLARRLCGWRPSIVASHLTLANSQWTAAEFRQRYGGYIPRVLYPGSNVSLGPGDPDWLPFVERENNFVIIGRIVPGKRIEEAVEIVRRLRERGRGLGLHIVGGEAGSGRYGARLRAMLADKPWVHMHTGLSRPALERLVARQKWGLHCYRFEHYGSAPAELQRLGCIVFAHDSGGQREVIANPAQRYTHLEDAVRKIEAVLSAPETHLMLVQQAGASSAAHTAEAFDQRFSDFLQGWGPPAMARAAGGAFEEPSSHD